VVADLGKVPSAVIFGHLLQKWILIQALCRRTRIVSADGYRIIQMITLTSEISGSHGDEYEVEFSGMYRYVVLMLTDVSEERTASIIRAMTPTAVQPTWSPGNH
jgi:hypothetical protein